MQDRYNIYSKYLKKRYGEKVYKIPINIPVSCPNRDGCIGYGGCIFCGDQGAGFESLSNSIPVSQQLMTNIEYIGRRYSANKFIAYFQNYTNTYMEPQRFASYIEEVCISDVVAIYISTRPDSINEQYFNMFKDINKKYNKDIVLELGLQTANYHTLRKVNRGHTLAEFIDTVINAKKYGVQVCAHLILNLPWDDMDDVIESAKLVSAMRVDQVKLHSLYILKNTVIGNMYLNGDINISSMDDYINRVVTFLEYLAPDIVVQRLIGRAPEQETLFANWNTSWWKIKDLIIEKMLQKDTYQGKKFNYLGGKVLDLKLKK
ncbi:MAG: TIGR01212 family radical SAM protein [Clostridia bacterium]|nr:TIGR01212 family radical SAM protein [Clostridia bacterium]